MTGLGELTAAELGAMFSARPDAPKPGPLTFERGQTPEGHALLTRSGRCAAGCATGWTVEHRDGVSQAVPCPECGRRSAAAERFNAACFPAWVHTLRETWRDVVRVDGQDAPVTRADCAALAASMRAGGPGACWYGGVGRGKSTLAAATALAWVQAGGMCRWLDWDALLGDLRDAMARRDPLKPLVARYVSTPLLVVDDVARRASEWAAEVGEQVIGARADAGRPMLITSNRDLAGLQDALGDRTWSRLSRAVTVARVVGEDLRGAA